MSEEKIETKKKREGCLEGSWFGSCSRWRASSNTS